MFSRLHPSDQGSRWCVIPRFKNNDSDSARLSSLLALFTSFPRLQTYKQTIIGQMFQRSANPEIKKTHVSRMSKVTGPKTMLREGMAVLRVCAVRCFLLKSK